MKNQRRKIIAVVLLLLILVLGGASIFVATRISTARPVAPTAPESEPRASVACVAPASCMSITDGCPTGTQEIPGSDCSATETCCTPVEGAWVTSAACSIAAVISAPLCTPRPICLDTTPVPANCLTTVPAGGYCPFLTCPTGKTIFKNIADNTPGTYNMDPVNQLTSAAGINLTPGQIYVYAVNFVTDKPGQSTTGGTDGGVVNNNGISSATVVDTLDPRLAFMDSTKKSNGTPACVVANSVVTCSLDNTAVSTNGLVAFRVKVDEDAATGAITNRAVITSNSQSQVACVNQGTIIPASTVALACKTQTALNEAGTSVVGYLGKDQTFQYSFDLVNNGNTAATGVTLTNTLSNKLVFVSGTGCTYAEATRTVTCVTNLNAAETKKITFLVKTLTTLVDGETISNTANVNLATAAAGSTGSECIKDLVVAIPNVTAVKRAYKDNSNNQAGVYQLTDAIDTVSKNQIFVYAVEMQNSGTGTASGVAIADPLTGQSQDQLTLMDRDPRCDFATTEKLINCHIDIQPGNSDRIAFRVKVSDGIANGDVVKNVAKVVSPGQGEITVTKDLTVSTVLGCNNTCTSDAECTSGYVCDTTSSKCRTATCLTAESCVCPAAVTEAPPRIAVVTQAPAAAATATPTRVTTQAPDTLPDSGILDMPGVAAFGGGLLLAIIGLLLAL